MRGSAPEPADDVEQRQREDERIQMNSPSSLAQSFTGKRTAEIVGITYRQLDYWARTDLVRPSISDAKGSGSRRRYGYQDLLELKVIKTLLDAGIRLEMVRDAFGFLRDQLGEDIASANLVINGSKSVVAHSGQELVDILQNGQGVLNVLPLAGVKQEIDAAIIQLHPSPETGGSAKAGAAYLQAN